MDPLLTLLRRPVWPILVWAALAASFGAAFVLPPARDERPPVPMAIVIGLLSAPAYALVFEAIGRADLATGAVLGLVHGALAFAHRRRVHPKPGARVVLAWLLFGALLGFLYPGAA